MPPLGADGIITYKENPMESAKKILVELITSCLGKGKRREGIT